MTAKERGEALKRIPEYTEDRKFSKTLWHMLDWPLPETAVAEIGDRLLKLWFKWGLVLGPELGPLPAPDEIEEDDLSAIQLLKAKGDKPRIRVLVHTKPKYKIKEELRYLLGLLRSLRRREDGQPKEPAFPMPSSTKKPAVREGRKAGNACIFYLNLSFADERIIEAIMKEIPSRACTRALRSDHTIDMWECYDRHLKRESFYSMAGGYSDESSKYFEAVKRAKEFIKHVRLEASRRGKIVGL